METTGTDPRIDGQRQLCEAIGLNRQPHDKAFDTTTFTKNRQQFDNHSLTKTIFGASVTEALWMGTKGYRLSQKCRKMVEKCFE